TTARGKSGQSGGWCVLPPRQGPDVPRDAPRVGTLLGPDAAGHAAAAQLPARRAAAAGPSDSYGSVADVNRGSCGPHAAAAGRKRLRPRAADPTPAACRPEADSGGGAASLRVVVPDRPEDR